MPASPEFVAEAYIASGLALGLLVFALGAALCLDRWDEIPRLFTAADEAQRQIYLVLADLNGKPRAVRWMLQAGVPANKTSADIYGHGTPLHHAVCS